LGYLAELNSRMVGGLGFGSAKRWENHLLIPANSEIHFQLNNAGPERSAAERL
jgi:hypothetical protein